MKRTIKLLALVAMAAGVTFASCQKEENDNGGNADNVEWVDLGLPSGLLWANCNLGATSPEEYGDYYAWGETRPKEVYSWSAYKYCTVDAEGDLLTLTKYNFSADYGTPDSLFTLEAMDDAATAALGNGARMPTSADWEELIRNTTAQWDTVNGIGGPRWKKRWLLGFDAFQLRPLYAGIRPIRQEQYECAFRCSPQIGTIGTRRA